ncbi:ephrin-A4 isoform X2 [Nycticebus coucang]|uniref:ephrin-A4 isoform X2 n=1 Tax=Nycticebus coucang TaxID=9470 RepID=UPI00234C6AA4|nr:ephrin-A4 isoform X2 [Nycticebus coucang]
MRLLPLLQTVLWAAFLGSPLRGGSSLRHVVYWNSSNPRLLRGDAVLELGLNDYLDIFCPHYEGPGPPEGPETFTLYMVDRPGYEVCQAEGPGAFKRWVCSLPFTHVQFSEKIQRFTPFSLGFEFLPGETYYYISVPTPESPGQCLRLQVSVCCKESRARAFPRSTGGGVPIVCTGGANPDRSGRALMEEVRRSEVTLASACPLITG